MGSIGIGKSSSSLGVSEVKKVLGADSITFDSNPEFVKALAEAELEYNEDGEVKFKFAGKDKSSGRMVLMEVSAMDKKSAQNDIRANGYTIQRMYSTQVYDAIINHTDGERWDLADATKVDNALLKKNERRGK